MKMFRLLSLFFLVPFFALAQEKPAPFNIPVLSPLTASAFSNQALHVARRQTTESKSLTIGGAFMRSLVIPGWGQRRVGARTSARNFFVAEVLLWGGFTGFTVYGNWVKGDYKLFAAKQANALVSGKDEQYFVDLGNFNSVEEYNESRLRRRDTETLYDPATHFWRWDTEANRTRFFNMRKRSDRSFANADLVVASIVANHILSGIHAAWVTYKKSAKGEKERGEVNVPQFGVITTPEEIRLVARLEF